MLNTTANIFLEKIGPHVSSVTEIHFLVSVRLRLIPLVSGVFGLAPLWAHGGPQT